MISPESFHTRTLSQFPAVRRILAAAIQAVEPGTAVSRYLKREGDQLSINGKDYALGEVRRIHVLALGKAAHAMAAALSGALAGRLYRGLIISKHRSGARVPGFEQIIGGHPVPTEASLRAGRRALEFLTTVGKEDLLLCLISGGGSALMTAPVPGVTLDEIGRLTAALLQSGARIDEINSLRRRLDLLKGGRAVQKVYPARVASLILSDVVGSPLEAIASGPTAPDPSSGDDALGVIEKYELTDTIPAAIAEALRRSRETPGPADEIFDRVQNVIVGSNEQAAEAGLEAARAEGFHAWMAQTDLQGEARAAAKMICDRLKDAIRRELRPFCLIAGGETTVTVRGAGLGGRNQELALAAVTELADFEDVMLTALATDGEDGATAAAGAVVTGETYRRGAAYNLSPQHYLEENDSYHYFKALEDLLQPGPTGTNVNDLIFGFGF